MSYCDQVCFYSEDTTSLLSSQFSKDMEQEVTNEDHVFCLELAGGISAII
jgi:hypothetical protein